MVWDVLFNISLCDPQRSLRPDSSRPRDIVNTSLERFFSTKNKFSYLRTPWIFLPPDALESKKTITKALRSYTKTEGGEGCVGLGAVSEWGDGGGMGDGVACFLF